MKKNLFNEVEIPEGVSVELDGSTFKFKGKEGENSRTFNLGRLDVKIENNKITLGNTKSTKTEKKLMNTICAHLRNLIVGVQEKFEYKLKICYGHFPFTVKQQGKEIVIKNFLGEKVDRFVSVPEGVEVEIQKDIISVKSIDKEIAGQASANFEAATKIKGRDKRTFQDGIYIIEKAGKII